MLKDLLSVDLSDFFSNPFCIIFQWMLWHYKKKQNNPVVNHFSLFHATILQSVSSPIPLSPLQHPCLTERVVILQVSPQSKPKPCFLILLLLLYILFLVLLYHCWDEMTGVTCSIQVGGYFWPLEKRHKRNTWWHRWIWECFHTE